MNKQKLQMLEQYIKLEMSPILLEDISTSNIKNAVVLPANCDISFLNGHYEGIEFLPPQWYAELLAKSKQTHSLLLIPNINQIPQEEQTKFLELFKYKKISTFDLPKNTIIIATASNLKEKPIIEEIYSLMIHI